MNTRARLALLAAGLCLIAVTQAEEEPPQYKRGDTFIYDNGRVEQVISSDGDAITWTTLGGRRYVRDRNFVLPLLQWQTEQSQGKRHVSAQARALWPFVPGKHARFRVLTKSLVRGDDGLFKSRRSTELWSCAVSGPLQLTLKVGTFDVLEISCERFSAYTMRAIKREEWYFSQDVGHYVRRSSIDLLTGRRTTFSLGATLTGMDANPKRIRSILSAL